jgi:hypothetical protein
MRDSRTFRGERELGGKVAAVRESAIGTIRTGHGKEDRPGSMPARSDIR